MTTWAALILFLYILKEAFEYGVHLLNLRHMKAEGARVPPEFSGLIDNALMEKTHAYVAENTRFGLVASFFSSLAAVAFIFGGVLNSYSSWVASLELPFIVSGWLYFLLLAYAGESLSLPFSLYHTFRIENKYGFNTMTFRLWISDKVKSLVISTVLLSLLLPAAFWLIQGSPRLWWLWVWGFLFLFSLFVMYISPYVIEPLFNKFTPVEDEALKERIIALAEKAGIHAGRILRVDASRRSRHTNAYFTGIGKTKRIVLYDTLLGSMTRTEVLSVLAHEMGHWKKGHILKGLAAFEVFSFVSLFAAHRILQSDILSGIFSLGADAYFAKLLVLGFVAGIVMLPLKPVVNFFSRRHERQADRISCELTGDVRSMVSALVKLSKENLSNLHPHPLYAALYYSHPPVVQRIRFLKGLSKDNRELTGQSA